MSATGAGERSEAGAARGRGCGTRPSRQGAGGAQPRAARPRDWGGPRDGGTGERWRDRTAGSHVARP